MKRAMGIAVLAMGLLGCTAQPSAELHELTLEPEVRVALSLCGGGFFVNDNLITPGVFQTLSDDYRSSSQQAAVITQFYRCLDSMTAEAYADNMQQARLRIQDPRKAQ